MKRGFTRTLTLPLHLLSKCGFDRRQIKCRGFTILELLVVVAIIGLLAGAVLASLSTAKVKSRDARRLSDIGEIRNGLNLYFTDNNVFPIFPSGVNIIGTDAFSTTLTSANVMIQVPADPISPTYDYVYTSNSNGTDFIISFCLEGTSIRDYSQGCGNTVTP